VKPADLLTKLLTVLLVKLMCRGVMPVSLKIRTLHWKTNVHKCLLWRRNSASLIRILQKRNLSLKS